MRKRHKEKNAGRISTITQSTSRDDISALAMNWRIFTDSTLTICTRRATMIMRCKSTKRLSVTCHRPMSSARLVRLVGATNCECFAIDAIFFVYSLNVIYACISKQ